MRKEVYTTQELMPVFGVAVESTITRRAKRENWDLVGRSGVGGAIGWRLASMPQHAQLAIRTHEERQALAACEGIVPAPALQIHAESNAIGAAILDDRRRRKALAKADLVCLFLDWQRKHGFTQKQKDAFIYAYLGRAWPKLLEALGESVSWKSIERWKLQQAEAGDVRALVDKRGIALKGRTLLSEQHNIIILGQILNPNSPAVGQCIRRIQKRCIAEDLHVPSEATIRRFVKAYTAECYDEWVLWREGKKAWNDKCAISLLRDWSRVEVGDVVIADGHTLNFETINPDTGKAKRMTLLLFYDGASNHPLGWEIMATENVACISSAFRRTCIVLGKIPRVVYLDNGKAFRAKFFKGTSDFREAGFLGLYKDLGCEVIHAWPYHGQSKPVERFFGTFHDMEVFVPSYTGNSIAAKPARMKRGEPLHGKLYKAMGGRALTLEETNTAIARWFQEYVERPQPRSHLAGHSPAEIFQAGVGPGVDSARLTLMMLQKEIKTIYKDGIKHLDRWYWHEALASRRHKVLIRYDDQLSPYTIFVYTTDGDFICEAKDRQYFRIAAGLHPAARALGSEEDVRELSEAIDLKRGREKLAGANMTTMLEEVIKPEALRRQAALLEGSTPLERVKAALPKPVAAQRPLSAEKIAAIEAAKAKARAENDTKKASKIDYEPAITQRFKDEMAKYDYLFKVRYERSLDLVLQDAAWMEQFEESDTYLRYMKRRYDQLRELYERRRMAV